MAARVLEKLQLEMKETIDSLECIQTVSVSSRNNDIRFLCRVFDEAQWLGIISEFLERESGWYSFIGKKYFLNEGQLVFGWVLIFEADDMDEAVTGIRRLLMQIHDGIAANEPAPGAIEVPLAHLPPLTAEMQGRVRPVR